MKIEEKFEKGAADRTYQRIDSEYKVDIFLGYNDEGKMSMVITEPGKETKVHSSDQITVSLKKREDKKMALTFDLKDDSYKSLFYVFCRDIIIVCEKAGSQMAISNALVRWKYWIKMFEKKHNDLLNTMEIKGLLGELIELKDHFFKDFGETKAIQSWMGPLSGHKDFEIGDTWYELKAVSENAILVSISSLEQLDSDVTGHLVINKIEDTSSVSEFALNLNKLYLDICNMIKDPDNLELFRNRLSSVGYWPNEEYDNYNFVFKGRTCYKVENGFPRLTRSNVPRAIGKVTYSIMINELENFKEE